MSTDKWFISILILIVFIAVIWVYVLRPGWMRLSNYVYLFFILSMLRPNEPQDLRIRSASRIIQYDQVVRLLTKIRKQPILTTREVNFSRRILSELRRDGHSEVVILRASINMLRQFTAFGFDTLPLQLIDSDIDEVSRKINQMLSKEIDFKPVEVIFFIVLGNKNLSHYFK